MRPLVFLALCVLCTPLFSAPAQASDELDRFFASDFTYCDAKVLAGLWGGDVYDAKARIGRKIGWGDVDTVLKPMREQAGRQTVSNNALRCDFFETSFTYGDAELLAKAWKISVGEAKAALALKASVGGEAATRKMVLDPLRGTPAAPSGALDTCHTKMLTHLWGQNQAEVRATVQRKVGMGNQAYVTSEIEEARKLARASERVACSFWDTPYTYQDAELLAGKWGQTVSQAKAHVELKYKNGLEDWLAGELTSARGR